jgi:hypothetical protein
MTDHQDPQRQAVSQTPEHHLQKSAIHQSLSNHLAKFPHHTQPGQLYQHYQNRDLISPFYRHQILNALALLRLGKNNFKQVWLQWLQLWRLLQQQQPNLPPPPLMLKHHHMGLTSPNLPLIWLMEKRNMKWNKPVLTGDGGVARPCNIL